ncbi:MAG: hypothetical protein KOO60_13740 [Gemmatimonadales bacterium]|nr:hypothetical protein [Gemmatimonadales bacterium]
MLTICLLAVLTLLAGCSDSSDITTPDQEPQFSYLPEAENLALEFPNKQFFRVTVSPDGDYSVNWVVQGQVVGNEDTFNYSPNLVGLDTVRVVTNYGDHTDEHEWVITVSSTADDIPPEVTGLALEDGLEPGILSLRWGSVPGSIYPMQDYLVAMRYDGPVSIEDWDNATLLEVVPHDQSVIQYARNYPLDPGMDVWFGVRARDEVGQMSDISRSYRHTVTYPWTLGITVKDEWGEPVPLVILKWTANGVAYSGNTPTDGFLEIGPFRNIDEISLETQINHGGFFGEFYDFKDPAISDADGMDLDIILIPRFGSDETCPDFGGEFLEYFRYMTGTDTIFDDLRPDNCLWKWDSYPLRVYLPEFTRGDDLNLKEVSLDGIQTWNSLMGEDYFIIAESEAEADVVLSFPAMVNDFGLVTWLEPSDEEYFIGSTVPEKMKVEIDSSREQSGAEFIQITVMHELGHVLGAYRHAPCSNSDYLMYVAVSSDLDDENGGIHPDERNLVHMIRHLPQGVDMSHYLLD